MCGVRYTRLQPSCQAKTIKKQVYLLPDNRDSVHPEMKTGAANAMQFLCYSIVPRPGFEPGILGFSVRLSVGFFKIISKIYIHMLQDDMTVSLNLMTSFIRICPVWCGLCFSHLLCKVPWSKVKAIDWQFWHFQTYQQIYLFPLSML